MFPTFRCRISYRLDFIGAGDEARTRDPQLGNQLFESNSLILRSTPLHAADVVSLGCTSSPPQVTATVCPTCGAPLAADRRLAGVDAGGPAAARSAPRPTVDSFGVHLDRWGEQTANRDASGWLLAQDSVCRLIKSFGALPVADITPLLVQAYAQARLDEGLGADVVDDDVRVLNEILNDKVEDNVAASSAVSVRVDADGHMAVQPSFSTHVSAALPSAQQTQEAALPCIGKPATATGWSSFKLGQRWSADGTPAAGTRDDDDHGGRR